MDTDADLLTPVVTPFSDGTVDEDALAALVADCVEGGLDGVVPCGTTGEFAALSDAEYERVVETTVDAAGEANVIAGACDTAVDDVRRRVDVAAAAGADAVLVVAPYYDAATEPAGNEAFFEAALADATLPAYLYNIPSHAGQAIDVETVLSLAERGLVDGIKDTSGDQRYLGELLRRRPDSFAVYQGYDGAFVPSLALGADGGINALAQVIPDAFADAAAAVERGDIETARDVQLDRIGPAFEACLDHGFAPVVKSVLASEGRIPSATVRPPLCRPTEDQCERVIATI